MVNSVDLDEAAHNELPQQDLHSLELKFLKSSLQSSHILLAHSAALSRIFLTSELQSFQDKVLFVTDFFVYIRGKSYVSILTVTRETCIIQMLPVFRH